MKKQASDQLSHERRYQERKRAEAARKPMKKNVTEAAKPAVDSQLPTAQTRSSN
ncbi:MAG TPA: hypothetical protein VIH89_13985 [Candidatus Sulfotelmatobacter sp.]|jgi:hypothetical protein